MIAHVVLFRPRSDVSVSDQRGLIDAFGHALREIPVIRRATIGRRISLGKAYEALTAADYPYAAILEFDDLSGLDAYLAAPSHQQLASRFNDILEEALTYDFEMGEGETGLSALLRNDRVGL